ncbi:MAG TPA: polyprenol monophosphomannose synthase [archaeon]|nr:polyprenol monophosphomannose synthase [archaeon]
MTKTCVLVPTYNERENVKNLLPELCQVLETAVGNDYEVIVVDDHSPDGTGNIVKSFSRKNKRVLLLDRLGPRGRGFAGIEAFALCLKRNCGVVVEMDADFSHDPKDLPKLLRALKRHDLVLGSRFVSGGRQEGRGLPRRIVTAFANLYIRTLLGLKVSDCNSGFRAMRRKVVESLLPELKATGPDIVQEVLFKAHEHGFNIGEVPITFKDRTVGQSKLGFKHLVKGYFVVLRLKLESLLSAKK